MLKYLSQAAVGGGVDPAGAVSNIDSAGVIAIMERVISLMYGAALIFATIAIIFAAFQYATAGSSSDGIRNANRAIIYAVVAVIAAILSKGLTSLVAQFISG